MLIKDNIEIIKNKINDSEIKAGRPSGSVKLMAVSKFHPVASIIEAIKAGQTLFGENRVQEVKEKFPEIFELYPENNLHLIGQLQSNKAKTIVPFVNTIESIDRVDLLEVLEKQCLKIDKTINILLEVHTGEESKSGFDSKESVFTVLDNFEAGKYPHLNPNGFMTMAPFTDNKALIHKSFETLRLLKEECQSKYKNFDLSELSMGMSGDFEIAIEEGSTLVRVGTAIFGERVY